MEKYIILIIIIIILYYIHKYCIQLEVNIILTTKNNINKFTNVEQTPVQQEQTPAQQEQALLEIQSKVKESMKAFYKLVTQVKEYPEVEQNLITKNSTENFSNTLSFVGSDRVSQSSNFILSSPEIEEIIQKFWALVYTVSRLPQTNQTMDAIYKLGIEVMALSETRAIVNDLRALLAKVKVNLPKSLNSISQELTQQVIRILDRLLTQINELLLIYSNISTNVTRTNVTSANISTNVTRANVTSANVTSTVRTSTNIQDAIISIVNKVTQGLGLSNDIVESIKNEVLTSLQSITGNKFSVSNELKNILILIVRSAAIQYSLLKSKHIKEMGNLVASYAVANIISSPIETLEQSLQVATTTQSIIIQAHKYIQDSLEIATNIALNRVDSGQISTYAQLLVGAAMYGTIHILEVTNTSQSNQMSLQKEEAQKELYYLTLNILTSVEPKLSFMSNNILKNRPFIGKHDEIDKIRNVFNQTKKPYVDQGYIDLGLIVGQAAAQRELATIVRQTTDLADIQNSILWKRLIIDVIEKAPKESYNQIQRDAINRRLVQLQAELQAALAEQKQKQ